MSAADRRDVAAVLLPSFAGRAVPEWVRRRVEDGLGGVVLFASNVGPGDELAALGAALRAGRDDLLVALDEEGGDVSRLEATRGSSYPAALALGAVDDPELTRRVAASIGADLARAGVNLNLAPVADVNVAADNPVIGVRSFGADPHLVARHVAAFVQGVQAAGVAACAKHFPGHGDTVVDSHRGLPRLGVDRARLDAVELVPFRAAVEAGVRAVMTAHVVVPALDDVPATLSRVLLADVLRGELAFDGLVVTDALDMGAIAGTLGVEESAVRALAAGADALCLGPGVDEAGVGRIEAAIVAAVDEGRLPGDRLADAARRVRRTGAAAVPQPAAPRDVSAGAEAARRALRVEGDVALPAAPLVVELVPDANVAAGDLPVGLGALLAARLPGTRVELVRAGAPARRPDSADGPVVVVVRDAHRHPWQRAAVEALADGGRGLVVVETGLPAWRPTAGTAYVACHGAGRASLEAVVERLAPPTRG